MKRIGFIFLIILLFFNCQSTQQQTDKKYESDYYATTVDMKNSGFVYVAHDNKKFFAMESFFVSAFDKDKEKIMTKAHKLNSEWFKKFIAINKFEDVYYDDKEKTFYGRGTFPLLSSVNTHLVFDFQVFSHGLIGFKIYNWRVYGAVQANRPNPWVRDFENEFISNYPSYWSIMKRYFQEYFFSYNIDVLEKL